MKTLYMVCIITALATLSSNALQQTKTTISPKTIARRIVLSKLNQDLIKIFDTIDRKGKIKTQNQLLVQVALLCINKTPEIIDNPKQSQEMLQEKLAQITVDSSWTRIEEDTDDEDEHKDEKKEQEPQQEQKK